MRLQFIKTAFFTFVILAFAALTAVGQSRQGAEVRDGVFVHVSHGSDSPHRFLMALKMAVTMAEDGKDVLVYCDIEAVKALVAGAPAVIFKDFSPSDEYLKRLGELKVQVLACPTCMKVANINSANLRPGVRVAEKDLFFSFTKGRILTLDY